MARCDAKPGRAIYMRALPKPGVAMLTLSQNGQIYMRAFARARDGNKDAESSPCPVDVVQDWYQRRSEPEVAGQC